MLGNKRRTCARDGCDHPCYGITKWCGTHYREEHPPKPRKAMTRNPPKPPKPRTAAPRGKKRKPLDDIPAEVRAFVLARSGGLCEACGKSLGSTVPHFHHRKRRRDGGHAPSNIVVLHGECHVVAPQAVHQRPTWARERGLIVPSWANPADVPLLIPSPDGPDRKVRLDDTTPEYLPPADGVLYAA